MKKFENPMLQVVSISKKDIITTSTNAPVEETEQANEKALAPDRFIWDIY